MPHPIRTSVLAAVLVAPGAFAANHPVSLTIYPATGSALFSGQSRGVQDVGHALVHETRAVELAAGTHSVRIDNLPTNMDPEATDISFGPGVTVQEQQLRVAHPLDDAVGQTVDVVTTNGASLHGTLLGWAADTGALLRTEDGKVHLVRRYTSMTLPSAAILDRGVLRLRVDARSAGRRIANITYMTSGLGWRAAYSATLGTGGGCRMQFKPEASIANRSGRDYDGASITLVAGQPNLGNPGIRMFSMAAPAPAAAAARELPTQAALGDYQSFTLPGTVNLPNDTVTLTPLYRPREMACSRQYIVTDGNAASPPRPNINDYGAQDYTDRPIASTLTFTAPDALPAGTLRAWLPNAAGGPALLGEGGVANTPKGQQVSVELGQSFNLRASRERTAFKVDAKGHTLLESYRITLSNGGDHARRVTVREHPNRWREWKVVAANVKPTKTTPQLLEFEVPVPAKGEATLTYSVQYAWTAQDL